MTHFYRKMDTVGDGTGSKSGVVDGSIAPVTLRIQPRRGERKLEIHRMLIMISDVGSFDSGLYGNNITLTNGIDVGLYDENDRLILDFMDGDNIITNADWGRLCYDTNHSSYGLGDEFLALRWTFTKAGGPLNIHKNQYLGVTLADNFTGLEQHIFTCQGQLK